MTKPSQTEVRTPSQIEELEALSLGDLQVEAAPRRTAQRVPLWGYPATYLLMGINIVVFCVMSFYGPLPVVIHQHAWSSILTAPFRFADAGAVWWDCLRPDSEGPVVAAGHRHVRACDGAAHHAQYVVPLEPGAVWRAAARQAWPGGGVSADRDDGDDVFLCVGHLHPPGSFGGGGLGRGVWHCRDLDCAALEPQTECAVERSAQPAGGR